MRRSFEGLVVALAVAYAGAFLWVAVRTVGYPFQLEWMEGGVVQVVGRVLARQPVYAAPTLAYVPYVYTPLYFYASAIAAAVVGPGMMAPRLVSLAATVCTAGLACRWVARETGRPVWGAAAAGLYLGTFGLSGFWFHLARVDALAVLLLGASAYALRFGRRGPAALGAGLLGAAAVLTKQTMLVALVPPLVVVVAQRGRFGAVALSSFVLCTGGACIALDTHSGGWFRYYTWVVPVLHRADFAQLGGLLRDGLLPLLPAVGLAAAGLMCLGRRDGRAAALLGAFGGGAFASSLVAALHSGAYLNVWMPAHLALALLAPLVALPPADAPAGEMPQAPPRPRGTGLLVPAMLAAQLALLAYRPARAIPTAADRRGGERFVAYLRATPGDVLVPQVRTLPALAGKRAYGLGMAADDLLRIDYPNEGTARLRADITEAIASERFSAIVLADPTPSPLLARHYRLADTIFAPDDESYYPVTGARSRPSYVFRPRGTSF